MPIVFHFSMVDIIIFLELVKKSNHSAQLIK
ncbi:MAG: hypothetical protein CNLJKLNK_00829 [Holosporales bacterium]